MLRFLREVEQIRHARLHAEGHLVLRDTGLDFRVAQDAVALVVKSGQFVELFAADFTRDTFGILEVEDAFAFIAELYPLEFGGQEARAPEAVVERLVVGTTATEGRHHHVGGEVGVFAAEAVGGPGADARTAGKLGARLHERDRRVMVDGFRVHGADHAPFVGLRGDVRHQLTEPIARLPVLVELEDRWGDWEVLLARGHRRQALSLANGIWQILAAHRFQLGLWVEEVHLGRSTGLEEVDDALRLWFKVREAQSRVSGEGWSADQRAQRGQADAPRGALDERAAGQGHLRGRIESEELTIVAVHSRVTVSSRLRRMLAVAVQAASWLRSRSVAAGLTPVARSLGARDGSAA